MTRRSPSKARAFAATTERGAELFARASEFAAKPRGRGAGGRHVDSGSLEVLGRDFSR
jgi:hypothetical protein